jgi:hypothetical protein
VCLVPVPFFFSVFDVNRKDAEGEFEILLKFLM